MRMPRIFYWMDSSHVPSGGEKHNYEHVDMLNAAGFDAYALHLVGGRCTWFDSTTRIVCGSDFWDLFDQREDYLVVPESLGPMIAGLPGRKVIFNKNLYIGFRSFDGTPDALRFPYTDPGVVATFTVSEHNERHLRFAFPGATVYRMYAGIDPAVVPYRAFREKRKRIVVVSKAGEALAVLMQMLRARSIAGLNALNDWEVTYLRGVRLDDAMRLMSESLMLVSLSTHEGLPRTVLEGMTAGCVIACYGTGPLKEILPPQYAFEPDDFVGLACHIESVTQGFPENETQWTEVIARGRSAAAAFSRRRQRETLIAAWTQILARHSLHNPAGRPLDASALSGSTA